MKRTSPLAHLKAVVAALAVIAWLGAVASGQDAKPAVEDAKPAEAAAAPKAGAGAGAVLRFGGGNMNGPLFIAKPGQVTVAKAVGIGQAATPLAMEPPVILLPGFPYIPLANPLAKADTRPGFLGVVLEPDAEEPGDEEPAKKDAPKTIRGVGISSVTDDSPAAKAGLKDDDRVLKLEGKEAKNSVQLRESIRALKPGQEVKLTIRREGKEMELKAKLGAAPDQIAGVQMLRLNGNIVIGGLNIQGDEPRAVPGVVTFREATSATRTVSSIPTDKDAVTLRDGNRFLGKILGMDPAKGLTLEREGQPTLELIEEEINALTFAEPRKADDAPKATKAEAMPKITLQLRDGSSLFGEALTMEKGMLRITLPGGQGIEIPREHAQSATLSDGESPQIYEGPTAMAGWTSGRYNPSQWEYKDGRLLCTGSSPIGRNLGRLPDSTELSFDVTFPRTMQHFGVMLFAKGVNESTIGNLTLNFSPNQITGSHYDGKRSNGYNAVREEKEPRVASAKSEKIRYRILVDRLNGRALIYINGEKLADWKLSKVKPEDFGKCGGAFSITPQTSISDMSFQLSNVRVLPWDGKEPAKDADAAPAKGDQTFTSAGGTTGGAIERITDSEIFLTTPEGKIAREKTVFLRFAEPAAPKEIPAAIAMAKLRNGSEISVAKVTGMGGSLTVTTRSGPEIALPFGELRSLDYLPRAGQAGAAQNSLDVLTLNDGSQIMGRAVVPFADAKVSWRISASKAPLEFASEKVAGVLFRGKDGERKAAPMKGDSAIRLGNGDWLPGDVTSLDGTRLVMRTDVAPEFSVPLSGLRAVYLNADAAATVADGATGPELWNEGAAPNRSNGLRQAMDETTKSERSWRYFDGGYTVMGVPRNGQQTVTRRWPAYAGAYAINFETSTPGRTTYFHAQIFNAKEERTFTVQASGTRMYIYYNPNSSRPNRVGMAAPKQLQIENKSEDGRARVSLVLDRPAKTFRIIIGEKEVGKIPFKEDDAKDALDACGVTLTTSYYSATASGHSRIDHLWLAPWNPPAAKTSAGAAKSADKPADKPPEKEAALAPDAGMKADFTPVIHLANGDDFPGTIDKITPELVTVNSDAGPLEFPVKRIAWIHFPNCSEPITDHYPRLRFHGRGVLSMNDLHITADRVQCKTLGGQALDFPLSVVKEIVWRPIADK